jgi:hypothetical protein
LRALAFLKVSHLCERWILLIILPGKVEAEFLRLAELLAVGKSRQDIGLYLASREKRALIVVDAPDRVLHVLCKRVLLIEILVGLVQVALILLLVSQRNALASFVLVVGDVGHNFVFEVEAVHVLAHPVFVPREDVLLKQLNALTAGRDVEHHKEDEWKANEDWYRDANLVKDLVRLRGHFHLAIVSSQP